MQTMNGYTIIAVKQVDDSEIILGACQNSDGAFEYVTARRAPGETRTWSNGRYYWDWRKDGYALVTALDDFNERS